VQTLPYGAPEVRCGRVGVEEWSSGGALLACRRGGMELRSSGDARQACRRRGICLKSPGGLEMHRKRVASLPQELWRCAAGV